MATMRAVVVKPPGGGPETLSVATDIPRPSLRSGEVLVEVRATALNRADTLQRKGKYPPPKGQSEIIGLECSGVVRELGPDPSGSVAVGDEVMALLPGGGYAEYVAVQGSHVIKKPAGMDFETAGAIPEAWLTAFQLLYFVGEFKAGDHVLVHAAGSGVGHALIQMATADGAKVIATASAGKLAKAKELGAIAGLDRHADWQDEISKITDGKGVQLVLDPVGGSYAQHNLDALSMDGIWVLYGLMGGPEVSGPFLRSVLKKRVQLRSTTLRTRSDEYKTRLVAAFAAKALPLFSSGHLDLHVDTVFSLDEVVAAHAMMDANRNAGKIVLRVSGTAPAGTGPKHAEL